MGARLTYQCSYCGKGWSSEADSSKQKPKVGHMCPCRPVLAILSQLQVGAGLREYNHWAAPPV